MLAGAVPTPWSGRRGGGGGGRGGGGGAAGAGRGGGRGRWGCGGKGGSGDFRWGGGVGGVWGGARGGGIGRAARRRQCVATRLRATVRSQASSSSREVSGADLAAAAQSCCIRSSQVCRSPPP